MPLASISMDSLIIPSIVVALLAACMVPSPDPAWRRTSILLGSLAGCLGIYALVQMGEGRLSEATAAHLITAALLTGILAGWLGAGEDDYPYGEDGGRWGRGWDDGDDDGGGGDGPGDPNWPRGPHGAGLDWEDFDQQREAWELERVGQAII